LTAWNGLMISALARAYEALDIKEYLSLAENAAKFLKERMYDAGKKQLLRSFREEPGNINGFSDDYSFLIQGLIDLYECSFDENYLKWAIDLQETQNELFYDQNSGGYFNVPETNKDILLRMKDDHDGAEPSANSVAVSNLIRLYAFTQNSDYNAKAEATLQTYGDNLQNHPHSMTSLVS
ncbi:6368_t:CDS:2, partial [Ambispora leptoticha]